MASLGTATLELTTDSSRLRRGLNDAEGDAKRGFGAMGTAALAAGAAIFAGIGVVAVAGFREMNQAALVMAQTEAVLISTGGAANVTAGEITKLAGALMAKSGVDDEAIQTGENMLLTFTKVRNEVGAGNDIFNQATAAILDMDTHMSHGNVTAENMAKTSILVGKALNDPIAGLTALGKAGVKFTDEQKAMIKGFVEAGDVMSAQKVILEELNTQFGGSAKAMGDTLPGQISLLKERFSNLSGDIMSGLLPTLLAVTAALSSVIDWMQNGQSITERFTAVMDKLGVSAATQETILRVLGTAFEAVKDAVAFVVDYVQAHWDEISEKVRNGMEDVRTIITTVTAAVEFIWKNFGTQITAVAKIAWDLVSGTVRTTMQVIQGVINLFMGLISGDWGRAWDGIKGILGGVFGAIKIALDAALGLMKIAAALAWAAISATASGAWNGIKGTLVGIWDAIKKAANSTWDAIETGIKTALTEVAKQAIKIGLAILEPFTHLPFGLGEKFQAIKRSLETNLAALESSGREGGRRIGEAITGGMTAGVAATTGAAANSVAAAVRAMVAAGESAGDIKSPSKVTYEKIGVPFIQGIILAIQNGKDPLASAVKMTLTEAIAAGVTAIAEAKTTFTTAFGALADAALQGFSTRASAWKSPSQVLLDRAQLQDQILQYTLAVQTGLAGVNAAKNAIMDAQATVDKTRAANSGADQNEETQKAYDAAVIALGVANGGLTTAEGTYQTAKRSLYEFNLAQKAISETNAHTASTLEHETHIKALTKQLETELPEQVKKWVTSHTDINGKVAEFHAGQFLLTNPHFAGLLKQLQDELGKHSPEWRKTHEGILSLINGLEGQYEDTGRKIGEAFIRGFSGATAQEMGRMIGAMNTYFPNAQVVPYGDGTPGLATGGYVSRTGLAVVHQGETWNGDGVGGRTNGGGGPVTVALYVGEREFGQAVISSLTKSQRHNVSLGIA